MRRKTITGWMIFLVYFVSPAFAGTSLWEASKDSHRMYIMGSIHLLKSTDYPLVQQVEARFAESEVLVLEVANPDDPAQARAMMEKATLPKGQTLQTLLDPESYIIAKSLAQRISMPVEPFHNYKPWMFTIAVSVTLLIQNGYSPDMGLDLHFLRKAQATNMPVLGLETMAFQIDMLEQIGDKFPNELIRQTATDIENMPIMVDKMVAAWKVGDVNEIGLLMNDGMDEFPELEKILLTERNKRWVPQLMTFLSSGKVHFVVFGAGHLPGESGVLNLLKAQGVTLRQL